MMLHRQMMTQKFRSDEDPPRTMKPLTAADLTKRTADIKRRAPQQQQEQDSDSKPGVRIRSGIKQWYWRNLWRRW